MIKVNNFCCSFLILSFLIFTTSCGSDKSAPEYLEKARSDYQAGDLNASLINLKNVLQIDPELAEARYLLGKIFIETGEAGKALKQFDRAKELGINDAELDSLVYRGLFMNGDFQRLLDLAPGVDDEESNADILALRGHAWLAQEDTESASMEYENALKAEPEHDEASLGLIKIQLLEGDRAAVKFKLEKLIARAPEFSEAWFFDGQIKLQDNEFEAAENAFLNALKHTHNTYQLRLGLIRSLLAQENWQRSEEEIRILAKEKPGNPIANYFLGYLEFQRKNFEKAKDELTKVFTVAPDYPLSSLLLATIYYQEGDFLLAEEQINRYLAKINNNIAALKLAAAINLKLNDPEKAVSLLLPALQAGENDAQYLSLLGNAYLLSGNEEESTRYLSRAATLSPDETRIKTDLALSQYRTGNIENALEELDAVIELEPGMVKATYLKILINLQRREFKQAVADIEEAIANDPENPTYYNLMGAAYLGLNEFEKSRTSIEKALEIRQEFIPAISNLALLNLKEGNVAAAVKEYEKILAINPNNVRAQIGLAQIEFSDGKYETAMDRLESARRNSKNALSVRIILARYYLQKNDIQKLAGIADEIRSIAPNRQDSLMILGQVARASGNSDSAIKSFEKVLEMNPESTSALYELAYTQVRMGQNDKAKTALEKLLSLEPENIPAIKELISVHLNQKSFDEALKLAKKVKTILPDSPEGDAIEGDIYARQGELAAAIVAYEKANSIKETSFLVIKLHKAYEGNGESEKSMQILHDWLKAHPDDLNVMLFLAENHMVKGENDDAIRLYEKILKQRQNIVVALNNLAYLYHERGDERALMLAEKAYQASPSVAGIADTYGWILIETGKVEQGLSIFEKLVSGEIVNPGIAYHYAVGLNKSGNKRSAENYLRKALATEGEFAERDEAAKLLEQIQE